MKLPWKRYAKRRGAGILTVLVASTLLLLLAFTVAGTSFHHLSVSNRLHHSQSARNLAEAALAKAVAEIMHTNDKYQGTVTTDFSDPQSPGALLAFNPANVATLNANLKTVQLETSVNNFGSDAPITVSGRTLPGESAYLRAVGVDHGVERAMECLIYIPKFPWAIASGGKVSISGASKIAAFEDMADINDPTKELPGHLVANSSVTDALVLQGNQITVTGDAQTSGGADFGQNVIKGERRLGANEAKIPDINIESYNPLGQTGCTSMTPGSQASTPVSGLNHSSGAVNYANGLTLDGGVLYVDGDVTIHGQVTGEGAIISTGRVTIQASGQVASNNKVAILSKDDLTLTGTSSDRLRLSGIVYSEGKITTDYASIFGNTVSPSASGMDLKDTELYMVDGAVSISTPGTPGGADPELPANYTLPSLTTQIPFNLPISNILLKPPITASINAPLAQFRDPVTGKYMLRRQTSKAWDNSTPIQQALPPGMYETRHDPLTGNDYEVPAPTGTPPLTNGDITLQFGAQTVAGDDPQLISKAQTYIIGYAEAQLGTTLIEPELGLLKALVASQYGDVLSNAMRDDIRVLSRDLSGRVDSGSNPPGTSGTPIFSLDLNQDDPGHVHLSQYLSRAERMRVLYWRDVVQ
jgi:hypothetical protein